LVFIFKAHAETKSLPYKFNRNGNFCLSGPTRLKGGKNTKNMRALNLALSPILYLYAGMTSIAKTSAWFLIVLLLTATCLDEPDCFHLNNNFVGISFKKLEDSSTDTMVVTGLATLESALRFADDTSFSRVTLPLDYFGDKTTYLFGTAEGVESIQLEYVSRAQFVSENCGEKFVLSGLRVGRHTFDSVRLVHDTPSNQGGIIHIEIFQ